MRTLPYPTLRSNYQERFPPPSSSPASTVHLWLAPWERAARDMRKNMNFGIRMNWNLSFESASSVTLSKSFCLRYCPLLPSPHFWTKTLIFPRMGVAKVVG